MNTLSPGSLILTVDHVTNLLTVLKKAREKWYFIGVALGCGIADLNDIDHRYHPDKMRCLQVMLQQRIQRGGLTLSFLCDSLRGKLVERNDIADEIKKL